ncbi:Ti-type conjugative transfer relaxase TraA [uncultured Erythrobacter sp.]|uniref:Ti-type conjugative transfer relaxase TraA n=1 Tax=uncultured Erythrobacter sp. TaxID=263913 RepID=UPI00265A4236|nr:Ti-type conjugative transfer relaxase TraA [uncultured Erythrobacter sp.]
MAIYHLSVKVISRSAGRSAVAAAAYRCAGRLHDERIDRTHDFTNKGGVVHSEVLLPEGAPEHLSDREQLWNTVEASEKRKDAQLSREVEFAIPRELNQEQGIALARDFVQTEFVERGMIADLNVHWDLGVDGLAKPHAHVMLTMREVEGDGFGVKVRDWNRTELVEQWRERWAEHVNERLAELDIDARIDHRSLEAQGIGLEPQDKIGPAASRMEGRGLEAERIEEHRGIAERNGARIIADPSIALDAITHQQATFTNRDLARFVHRHSDGEEQFDQVMSAVRSAPDLVALGKDGRGEERFTSRQMITTEQRLERASALMAERQQHPVNERGREAALARATERGLVLTGEQRAAFEHVTGERGLSVVVGYAGTGKSAMLGVAREAWESAGYNVRGAALSGIATEGLENGSGIASRTVASLEHQWSEKRELLTSRDVLVIDEAGMVGTRQMERVLSHAADVGAKVVLVGDPQQLQAIEAGAAFRAIHERHGGVEITEVRRQREDWQRDATRQLATGRTGLAVAAYDERGMVHAAATREAARGELIERWDRERQASPANTRIILTHTNDEVRALNEAARARLRDAGELGEEVTINAERGARQFASGDRIMFLRNERELGVKNGTLGTVEEVTPQRMRVRIDDGRSMAFDLKDYAHIDHGYAATIHKAQGMTVDRAHVLATPGMDRHGAYVALSRHREGVALHYGRDDFADQSKLVRTLSRERGKDMASDYQRADPAQAFAERRGITFRERVAEIIRKVPEKVRGIFDGLRLPTAGADVREPAAPERKVAEDPEAELRRARTRALIRHARAVDDIFAVHDAGGKGSPEQLRELGAARKGFEEARPYGPTDAEAAYVKNPEIAREAGSGQVRRAVQALQLETELRTDPQRRADRFLARWQELKKAGERQYRTADMSGYRATRSAMGDMAKSLERDPQLESILANRKRELGISISSGSSLSGDLTLAYGLGRGRSRGIEI